MHYFFLVLILGMSVMFFNLFKGLPDIQFMIIVATAISYFLWGVVHHQLEGDFHLRIMLEYFLIALLGVFLIRGAILR